MWKSNSIKNFKLSLRKIFDIIHIIITILFTLAIIAYLLGGTLFIDFVDDISYTEQEIVINIIGCIIILFVISSFIKTVLYIIDRCKRKIVLYIIIIVLLIIGITIETAKLYYNAKNKSVIAINSKLENIQMEQVRFLYKQYGYGSPQESDVLIDEIIPWEDVDEFRNNGYYLSVECEAENELGTNAYYVYKNLHGDINNNNLNIILAKYALSENKKYIKVGYYDGKQYKAAPNIFYPKEYYKDMILLETLE